VGVDYKKSPMDYTVLCVKGLENIVKKRARKKKRKRLDEMSKPLTRWIKQEDAENKENV